MLAKLKNSFTKVRRWFQKNKVEFLLVSLILLFSAIFRLWDVGGYLDFKGDEGRDVRVVRRLIVEFDPVLIGPRTSIGDMYLGPLYYYFIAPALAVSGLSPVGPAAFVGLLGVLTVGMVWFIGREWFGKHAGLVASSLYAVSPVVIEQTRDSWNPNVMPFFALLSVYAIWRVWSNKEWKWLVVLGVSYAFVLQSHYLGLLLSPTLGVIWLLSLRKVWSDREKRTGLIKYSLLALVIFAFLMSPLVIFDARHGWRNFASMEKFFTERQATVSAKPWNALPGLWPLWSQDLIGRVFAGKNQELGVVVAAFLLVGLAWVLATFRKSLKESVLLVKKPGAPLFLTIVWVLVGLIGLGIYKQNIFDHYFGFIFPAPFLLAGLILSSAWNKSFKPFVVTAVAGLILFNLVENPLRYPPNRELARTQGVAREIMRESGGRPFNFALIAERNYEEGYLYFFELLGAPVYEIDPQRAGETITDQLFVVCEDYPTIEKPEPCNPINHAKAEIANFGWAKIEEERETRGLKLFKLVHTQE